MINPTVFLKKANQLVPIKELKKGQKPRHSLTLNDYGELVLSIVINQEKGRFYRVTLDNNSNPETVFTRCKDEVLELVKKFPVK